MEAVKMTFSMAPLGESGFRVEAGNFQKLHERGSDGLYYTQKRCGCDHLREGSRNTRGAPEFDMPDSTRVRGHPERAGKRPYRNRTEVGNLRCGDGPDNEKVYKVFDELIGEMAKVFPPLFSHRRRRGNGKEWDANPKIQAFMKAHGSRTMKH